ncbi:ribokinase [Thermophilibacter sp.]
MPKVVVFGSMNMDLSVEAPRMPKPGETLAGSGFVTAAGGKGANQAVAAARLGAEVRMVAAVGADGFGAELVAGLEAAGADCSLVRRLPDAATGVAVILRTAGENRIVLSPGANHALAADDVVSDLRRIGQRGDVFVTQGECDPAATEAALRAARELGMRVIYNPAPARPVSDDLWACVDLVCLNETECQLICGVLPADDETCRAAADWLRTRGAGSVVITLGAAGSFAVGANGDELRVPAVPARVVDTTGAGDTLVGALAAGSARGLALEESLRWGTVAAAITVSRLGAQPSIPTAAEVEAAL